MARPKAKDGIRVTTRARDGIQLIHFEEYPSRWNHRPVDKPLQEKNGKTTVSFFIGNFALCDLTITDCGFSVDELDGLGSPILNRIMVQVESNRATTKEDIEKIFINY